MVKTLPRHTSIFLFLGLSYSLFFFICLQQGVYALSEEFSFYLFLDVLISIPLITAIYLYKRKGPLILLVPVVLFSSYVAVTFAPETHHDSIGWYAILLSGCAEGAALLFVINRIFRLKSEFKKSTQHNESPEFYDVLSKVLLRYVSPRIVPFIANELATFYYISTFYKRPIIKSNEYRYHIKSSGQLIGFTLIGIVLVEVVVGHYLILQWHVLTANIVTAVSIYSLFQILGVVFALSRRPIVIERDHLLLRYSFVNFVRIPFAAIKDVQRNSRVLECKGHQYLSVLSPFEGHNIRLTCNTELTLMGMYGSKKKFEIISFSVDEPEMFLSALSVAGVKGVY